MKTATITQEVISVSNNLYELLKEELRQSVIDFVDDSLGKEAAECTIDLLKKKYPRLIKIIEEENKDESGIKIQHDIDDNLKQEVAEYITTILKKEYPRLIEALKCGQEECTEEDAKEKAPYHYWELERYLKRVSNNRIPQAQKVIEKYKRIVTLFLKEEHREQCAEFYEVGLAED